MKLLILIMLSLPSPKVDTMIQNMTNGEVQIIPMNDEHEGREMFSVIFKDGKRIDYMYMEEISSCLKTGKWVYDEEVN